MTRVLLAYAAAYAVGSIPFGVVLVRLRSGKDLRRHGSGNIGATNALRTGGAVVGIATLLLDVLKGAAGVLAGLLVLGEPGVEPTSWAASFLVLAPVAGHCWPVWLLFRGGKGVATALGALAIADWRIAALAGAVFVLGSAVTRMASVGSLAAAATISVAAVALHGGSPLTAGAAGLVSIIVLRHRENIGRIMTGRERRIGEAADE